MIAPTPATESASGWTLAQRREFMKLSLAERRRQLETQADRMLEEYASESEARAEWQGGDVVES